MCVGEVVAGMVARRPKFSRRQRRIRRRAKACSIGKSYAEKKASLTNGFAREHPTMVTVESGLASEPESHDGHCDLFFEDVVGERPSKRLKRARPKPATSGVIGLTDLATEAQVPAVSCNAAPKGEVRPGDWTCPRCGDNVFARRVACRQCGAPKPNGEPATSEQIPSEGLPGATTQRPRVPQPMQAAATPAAESVASFPAARVEQASTPSPRASGREEAEADAFANLSRYLEGTRIAALPSEQRRAAAEAKRYYGDAKEATKTDDGYLTKLGAKTNCVICCGTGHKAHECSKLRCFVCFQCGHDTKHCPNKDLKCETCGKRGHQGDGCWWKELKDAGSKASRSLARCMNCGEEGHLICGDSFPSCEASAWSTSSPAPSEAAARIRAVLRGGRTGERSFNGNTWATEEASPAAETSSSFRRGGRRDAWTSDMGGREGDRGRGRGVTNGHDADRHAGSFGGRGGRGGGRGRGWAAQRASREDCEAEGAKGRGRGRGAARHQHHAETGANGNFKRQLAEMDDRRKSAKAQWDPTQLRAELQEKLSWQRGRNGISHSGKADDNVVFHGGVRKRVRDHSAQ